MEQKKRKRILYSICFVCLVLVDWIRGSQDGTYWQTAINLTGMFLAFVMMSHYKWKEEPLKIYLGWGILWLVGSLIGFAIWNIYPGTIYLSQYWTAAISVCAVGVAAIRIVRECRQKKSRPLGNHFLLMCWVVLSVLMTCSRLDEIWPAWYLTVFLLFYTTPFSEQERRGLWNSLADALIIGFFLLQIFAYGFRPYDELRYKGAFSNCNMNALFYMVTYVGLLYRSHSLRWQEKHEGIAVTWKRKVGKLTLWILTAGIWGFLFLTMTRTALLAIIGITVVYGIMEFLVIYKENIGKTLLRGVALGLSVVVIFPVVFLTARYLPTILHHPIWFSGEYSTQKVHSFDPADSEKYVSFEDILIGLGARLEKSEVLATEQEIAEIVESVGVVDEPPTQVEIAYVEQNNSEKSEGHNTDEQNSAEESMEEFEEESVAAEIVQEEEELLTGEAANSSMRIRLEIYKKYLKNLNLTGHELEEGYYPITSEFHAWHAQNLFVQISFYHGIVAGVLCVVLMIGLGIQSLKLAFRKRKCEDLLPLFVWLLFVGYGMLECVWYPGQTILLLIYLVPKIIIDGRE